MSQYFLQNRQRGMGAIRTEIIDGREVITYDDSDMNHHVTADSSGELLSALVTQTSSVDVSGNPPANQIVNAPLTKLAAATNPQIPLGVLLIGAALLWFYLKSK